MHRKNLKLRKLLPSLGIILAGAALAVPPPAPEGFKWVLNEDFTDEFEGDALDTKKWYDRHPRWPGRPPAKFMPENVSVKDGMLQLSNGTLEKPITVGRRYFTLGGAAVVSKKTEAFYGYYECRLKASSISMSSTFWMSHSAHYYPKIGKVSQELDILETVGGAKDNKQFAYYMNSNTHVWHGGDSDQVGNKAKLPTRSDKEFYVYGCWWEDASKCHFYLNNEHVGTVEFDTTLMKEPFRHPMHINMVTETYDWETPPSPEEINNPEINTTYIDWVRSYVLVPTDSSLNDWQLDKLQEEPREWKSSNGKKTTKAKLIKAKHGYAYLEKTDGKKIRVPINLLSKEDRELLAKVIKSY